MKVLLIDSNYLCYQARYSLPKLTSVAEIETQVVFGFLNRVLFLAKEFNTNRFIFFWDSRKSFRKDIYPLYKANRRKERTELELAIDHSLFKQASLLRKEVLPTIGFKNVFIQTGLEADDLIAHTLINNKFDSTIVSADEDLYQLLDHADMFNPSKKVIIDRRFFKSKYGINPCDWVEVKTIAGCNSDNVSGVYLIGEGKAIQYLLGGMKETTKSYEKIVDFEKSEQYKLNKRLVQLPFERTKPFEIDEDFINFSKKGFTEVCFEYDFDSFLERIETWEVFLK